MPGLDPQAGEIVLDKPASGIFTGTGLDELLRNLGIENLILAGISCDGAVEGSIRRRTLAAIRLCKPAIRGTTSS